MDRKREILSERELTVGDMAEEMGIHGGSVRESL